MNHLPDVMMVRQLLACPFRDETPLTPPKESDKAMDHISLGQWWMTRTGSIAHCAYCKAEIQRYEFRVIHCPAPKEEYDSKPPSYAAMHWKIKRDYFHIKLDCLPRPSASVEEVCDRD